MFSGRFSTKTKKESRHTIAIPFPYNKISYFGFLIILLREPPELVLQELLL
ncbi:hypothetical protein M2132_001385 [Dysgonomonas sp. PH5-45]|nr:hypothetical protein [Dysgonomonas sp. PH5-45]MDH6387948.1 hypothetical protein [Dysgonomonas sp. PH5-37]